MLTSLTENYRRLYERYRNNGIDHSEFNKGRCEIVDAAVKLVSETKTPEEIRREWFVDYGTMNGWGWETSFKYAVAAKLHEADAAARPELHKPAPWKYHWRGWSENNCACGLCSSCDSSD